MNKCTFCQNPADLHEAIAPAISVCTSCRGKLATHIGVICTHCQTLYWLKKSPENVMTAARMSDLEPQYIMDHYILHELKTCKRCYQPGKDFSASARFLH